METKQIKDLESYFKTENEHWNGFAFKMLCEVLQHGQFENPELPLKLYDRCTGMLVEHSKTPLKSVDLFAGELDKNNLNPPQKLFIYEWVCKYLKGSEFDEDLSPVIDLLAGHLKKLKAEVLPKRPRIKNIRETLKDLMQKELDQLPETLKGLEPIQRLNILCKLIPFVLPKVESVHSETGEPG